MNYCRGTSSRPINQWPPGYRTRPAGRAVRVLTSCERTDLCRLTYCAGRLMHAHFALSSLLSLLLFLLLAGGCSPVNPLAWRLSNAPNNKKCQLVFFSLAVSNRCCSFRRLLRISSFYAPPPSPTDCRRRAVITTKTYQ